MSVGKYFTVPITISNPTGDTTTDDDGVPTTVTTVVETLCHVQPLSTGRTVGSDEQTLGVEQALRSRIVWLPLDTLIGHKSTAVIYGDRYEVIGDPKDWRVGSPNDHLEVIMERVVT